MRLIDADEIEELFYKQVEYGATDLISAFDDALQDAKTVDAVPVVHGEWVLLKYWTNVFQCSKSGHVESSYNGTYPRDTSPYLVVFYPPKINYCPNCGVKMNAKEANP